MKVLFLHNFVAGKFCKNKTLAKISEFAVIVVISTQSGSASELMIEIEIDLRFVQWSINHLCFNSLHAG